MHQARPCSLQAVTATAFLLQSYKDLRTPFDVDESESDDDDSDSDFDDEAPLAKRKRPAPKKTPVSAPAKRPPSKGKKVRRKLLPAICCRPDAALFCVQQPAVSACLHLWCCSCSCDKGFKQAREAESHRGSCGLLMRSELPGSSQAGALMVQDVAFTDGGLDGEDSSDDDQPLAQRAVKLNR